jgi:methyl-accepting chemotaxis protein
VDAVRAFLWTPVDDANLPFIRKAVLSRMSAIVDRFYDRLQETPELARFLGDGSILPRLKKAQSDHWSTLFADGPTARYQERALRVGEAHARVGLTPDWYMAAYALMLNDLSAAAVSSLWMKPKRLQRVLGSLQRAIVFDMVTAVSAYESDIADNTEQARRTQQAIENLRQLAATIIDVNDATITLAELVKNSKTMAQTGEEIARAAHELVVSVEDITHNSQDAAIEAEQAYMAVSEGTTNADAARDAIGEISSAVRDTAASVQDLSEASEQIEQILAVIENIAEQTNLLALNATIEAARAGEAGKGFAVVANEVKNLANQTSRSTEDITQKINALRGGMEAIRNTMERSERAVRVGETAITATSDTMGSLSAQVTTVATKIQTISDILIQQQQSSESIAAAIGSVATMAADNNELVRQVSQSIQTSNTNITSNASQWFQDGSSRGLCELAKIDHVLFKKRIVDVIMGDAHWNPHEVPDCHGCRLGKWYDSVTDRRLTGNPHFRALKDPHQRVHDEGIQTLTCFHNGDMDGAVRHLRTMNQASTEVLQKLDALSRSLDDPAMAEVAE